MRRAVVLTRILFLSAVLALIGLVPSQAAGQRVDTGRQARAIYARDCQSCHGISGQGVSGTGPAIGTAGIQGAGPPLRGVGAAAADLYLSTGYMPLDNPHDPPKRSTPQYDSREIQALTAYVAGLGKGPPVPQVNPASGDVRQGLELFTENCAGCHQVIGKGGVVLNGVAPDLAHATPTEIAEAIRVGPYLMPPFSEKQLSDAQVASLIRYIGYSQDPIDRGGWGIGHIGPISEGFGAWLVAGLALVGLARFLGKRIGS